MSIPPPVTGNKLLAINPSPFLPFSISSSSVPSTSIVPIYTVIGQSTTIILYMQQEILEELNFCELLNFGDWRILAIEMQICTS